MHIVNKIVGTYFENRRKDINKVLLQSNDCQDKIRCNLIYSAKDTCWGKKYDFKSISSLSNFQQRVPISSYDDLYPYIERMIKGERDVLWRGKTSWFSKSSGTSGSKSKYIPISFESLWLCNFKAGKDTLTLYVNSHPDTKLFGGKTFSLTGSLRESEINTKAVCGDISAILLKCLPYWVNMFKTPPYRIALMSDWDKKLVAFADYLRHENVVAMAGVPSWILMILRKILEIEGQTNLKSIWPNLELFMHGGVNFSPYKSQYQSISGRPLNFLQVYNASEGYFAAQDLPERDDMLLFTNHGVFFEFISMQDFDKENSKVLSLNEVEIGQNYALVISTNAGLWRYLIGDVVQFTSVNPYRIKITGRTAHFINAFGEELMIDNVEKALEATCRKTDSEIKEYTGAPVYLQGNSKGAHQWLIEFEKEPQDLKVFTQIFDQELKKVNSDYEAKRSKDILLGMPQVQSVPKNIFLQWMTDNGKLGGQHKVPRLSNNRTIVEQILNIINCS